MKSYRWSLVCSILLFLFVGSSFVYAISEEEIANIESAVPKKPTVEPKQPRKMLVFSLCNGYRHSSIPYWDKALEIMGEKTGAFEVELSMDMSAFEADNLKRFDAVCLNNTTQLKFNNQQRKALMDFVKGGKAIVGIHAATDNFADWPEAAQMMGGSFSGHPWGAGGTWAVKIDDPKHPLTKAFAAKGFKINDEIYRTEPPLYSRTKQRVLLSLDMTDETTKERVEKATDMDTGISWIKTFGRGRVFYGSLGHNHHITWNPAILQYYLAGIQFALGDLKVDATPVAYEPAKAYEAKLDELVKGIEKYRWGQSRVPLRKLEDFVRGFLDSAEMCKMIENRFDAMLVSDVSLAVKQFICRQLSIMGTEQSVKTLASMLGDEATSDMARYALGRIPSDAVDKLLRRSLNETSGKIRIGIINSIGVRGDVEAVGLLEKFVSSDNAETASAAVSALGRIGTKQAADLLANQMEKVKIVTKKKFMDAYLNCGYKLTEAGKNRQALEIFEKVYKSEADRSSRIAAFRGMVGSSGRRAGSLIIEAIKEGDSYIQSATFTLIGKITDARQLAAVAGELNNLSAESQVQLLAALAESSRPAVVRGAVVSAVKSEEQAVRVAALKALAKVGDEKSVGLLAESAARAETSEGRAARESLYILRGDAVDKAIIKAIEKADSTVKAELIKSVGERRIYSAIDTLMRTARDSAFAVRRESLRALSVIAGGSDMPGLVEILVQAGEPDTRTEAAKTLIAAGRKIDDRNKRAEHILPVLEELDNIEAKIAFLDVLGKLGDDNSLDVLKEAADDSNTDIKAAAIRALSEWPTDKPIDVLKRTAKDSDDRRVRILALRGYVRMIRLDTNRLAEKTVQMYREAMKMAMDVSEKRTVLAGLAEIKSVEALEMAAEYLEVSELKGEAEPAVVKIASAVSGAAPEQTKSILDKLLETTSNNNVRRQARRVIEQIERFEGFITAWQVSGPYTKENVGADKLFDMVFAPEKDGDVKWQLMPVGTDEARVWLLELDKFFGGDNRVAYLKTKIWSDKEQKLRLELGSDDGIKVWLNGKQVLAHNVSRACGPGQEKVDITVNQGWNELLVKITQGGGQWAACAKIVNADGSKPEGLKIKAGD